MNHKKLIRLISNMVLILILSGCSTVGEMKNRDSSSFFSSGGRQIVIGRDAAVTAYGQRKHTCHLSLED